VKVSVTAERQFAEDLEKFGVVRVGGGGTTRWNHAVGGQRVGEVDELEVDAEAGILLAIQRAEDGAEMLAGERLAAAGDVRLASTFFSSCRSTFSAAPA